MASKGGRPFINGAVRYACGKINKIETERALKEAGKAKAAEDSGDVSPKIRRSRDLFSAKCFKGGGQGNHAGDAIGQLWLLGKLDVPNMDETRLLSATRAWWHGRSIMFKGMDYKTARFERASRSSAHDTRLSRPERDYLAYDKMLGDADHYDQECLADLMDTNIDGDFRSWVSRIIQTELARHVRLPLVELATEDDERKLDGAKRAMIAMAGVEAMGKAA